MVMVRQYRHAMDTVMIELCAGKCEDGETAEQSARRELLEETGYASGSDTFRFTSQDEAQAKFDEMRDMIDESFQGATDIEVVDEPDFYGKRMRDTGSYARVYFE